MSVVLVLGGTSEARALASALASYDGAAELDRGLDLLLLGLTATLTPPDRPSPC